MFTLCVPPDFIVVGLFLVSLPFVLGDGVGGGWGIALIVATVPPPLCQSLVCTALGPFLNDA